MVRERRGATRSALTPFADSSALVKLYADEPHASQVRDLEVVVVSQLARVEIPAAVWLKHRIGVLAREQAEVLVQQFEADYRGEEGGEITFDVIRVDEPVLARAARLAGSRGLRAYDAVQLATALTAHEKVDEVDAFACFDDQLRQAAAAESLEVWPSEL
ncbi:MAG: type II toxin-antitoxin system VapC family toxin [Dehalococcoidia bacterium]